MDDATLFRNMVEECKKSLIRYFTEGIYLETRSFHQLVRLKVKNIIEANPHDVLGTTVEFFMKSKIFFGRTFQKKNPSYIFLSTVVPTLKKDHRKAVKHEQRMLSFLANEMDKAGRKIEAHVVRTIVKPHMKEMGKGFEEMTAMQKFRAVERKF